MSANASREPAAGVWGFFQFVLREFPLARVALAMTGVVFVLEYATLSVMIPLAAAAGGGSSGGNPRVVALWSSVAHAMGVPLDLLGWVWLFLVMLALRSVVGYFHTLLTSRVSRQVHRTLSEAVFARVLFDEPITRIYRRTVGFYISLAGEDTFRAGTLIGSMLLVLAAAGSALCGLALLFLFSAGVFAGTVLFLGISAVLIGLCFKRLLVANSRSVDVSREAGTAFLEGLNSLRSLRSMGAEGFAHESYSMQMHEYASLLFKVDALKNGVRFVPGIVALLTGIVLLAPWSTAHPAVSAGAVFGATTILVRVFASLSTMMISGGALMIDLRAAKDLGELTQFWRHRALARRVTRVRPDSEPLQRIDMHNVCFAYEAGRDVLRDITLQLRQGHCYAVVGPSGSGKSTLSDVLLGIIEPGSGRLEMNGRLIHGEQLRNRVVLVEQQPRIFSVSVRENLTLGLEKTDEELLVALDTVALGEFVQSLPRGLGTPLDYQGANISGGQRQRLSIARALLRNPDVLILDEATSALDVQTRNSVVTSLRAFMRNGVIVFITHDETVAALADCVFEVRSPGPQVVAPRGAPLEEAQ